MRKAIINMILFGGILVTTQTQAWPWSRKPSTTTKVAPQPTVPQAVQAPVQVTAAGKK